MFMILYLDRLNHKYMACKRLMHDFLKSRSTAILYHYA